MNKTLTAGLAMLVLSSAATYQNLSAADDLLQDSGAWLAASTTAVADRRLRHMGDQDLGVTQQQMTQHPFAKPTSAIKFIH